MYVMLIYRRLIIGLLLLAVPTVYATGVFTVSGRDILMDGSPFEVRGVCYQPTPIGENPSTAPPWGDYFTAGYSNLWARDFANLRNMGANVIRCYGWTIGADHSAFLNAAYNGGDQSLYFLVNRWVDAKTDWNDTNAVNALVTEWEAIAMELKDHPAVMGLLIGNEINGHENNGSKPEFWSAMNQIAGAVKVVAPNKLVSVPLWDTVGHVQTWDASMSNLDFWGMQVYRGTGFGSLFSDYASYSTKPLVITEFGHDAYDAANGAEFADDAELPADAMEYLWREIRYNRAVVSGGCVFEYADEWWKVFGANPSIHDTTGWSGSAFIDGEGNEEWWGIFRVVDNGAAPDILEPRKMFYRLAAMWNEPFAPVFQQTGTSNGYVQTTFSYPEHLRAQPFRLKMSGDLDTWSTVARNSPSNTFASYSPVITLAAMETNQEIRVSLEHDPSAVLSINPHNLLSNGDFEEVNSYDWLTWGTLSTDVALDGSRSLKFAAAGGWTVPLAFQTTSALPGEEYNLSGYIYTPAPLPAGTTLGLLKIVFRDELGTDLPPASVSIGTVAAPPYYGAESVPVLNSGSPVGSWVFTQAQAVAPPNTVTVSFYVMDLDESANTMYFDSIEAVDATGIPAISNAAFFLIINSGR